MKKIILIPDSFKGTMGSSEICAVMHDEIRRYYPNSEIIAIPVADGGEGSVDCFLQALGGVKESVVVKNPFFEDMIGFYGLIKQGNEAVVEVAACAGLPLIEDRKDPLKATTVGVGQIILAAARKGVKQIIVGLGGTATNDGGCGAASAVGVKFFNKAGESFVPTGGTLCQIERIDTSEIDKVLAMVEITAMCDIDNPMYGPNGAAYIFASQKGADAEGIIKLDEGLRHLSEVISRDLGLNVSEIPGSGAAGAMGAGMIAFFGARLKMGIETVLDTVDFNGNLIGADLVLTGEGRIDNQSMRGKVVVGVARRAKEQGVPVVAVVGDIGDDIESIYEEGVSYIVSTNRVAKDFSFVRERARKDLSLTVSGLMRFFKRIESE